MKEKMSNNELYYWKVSPSDVCILGYAGYTGGWSSFLALAVFLWICNGAWTFYQTVKEA